MEKTFWNVVSWFSVRSIVARWRLADALYALTFWVDPIKEPRAGAVQESGVLPGPPPPPEARPNNTVKIARN